MGTTTDSVLTEVRSSVLEVFEPIGLAGSGWLEQSSAPFILIGRLQHEIQSRLAAE